MTISDVELIELAQRIQPLLPQRGRIDSTVNRGRDGVGSVALDETKVTSGYVLTATGDGGSTWGPASAANPSLPSLIFAHITIGDLVAWWRMGETSGVMLDYAQNPLGDKDLSLTTGSGTDHVSRGVTGGVSAGDDDGACDFTYNQAVADGGTIGDHFDAADSSNHRWAFNGTAAYTIECLIKPTSSWALAGNFGIFGVCNPALGSGPQGWFLGASRTTGGINVFATRGNSGASQTATAAALCAYGDWSHLAATFDGTTLRLYINGVLNASSGSTVSNTGEDDIQVGMQNIYSAGSSIARYFFGVIDEVAIYNAVLTPEEILQHAAGGVSIPSPPSPGDLLVYANGT